MDLEMENVTTSKSIWEFKAKFDYVDDWPLMKSPVPLFIIWVTYMIFVLKIGPQYMKNRKAYGLHSVLIVYNLLQVIYAAYIVSLGIRLLRPVNFINLSCNLDDETMSLITNGIYIYFVAKVSELLDTVFFVLRKKQNQVSFLHVYHHSMMLWISYLTMKFEPSYSTIFLGSLNSFVHVIMYTYYGLSAFPSLTKYLWWKKYITSLQLLQFMMIITHAAYNGVVSQCPPSYILFTCIIVNGFAFIYLFGEFYVQSYLKKGTASFNKVKHSNGTQANGANGHINGSDANGTKSYSNGTLTSNYKNGSAIGKTETNKKVL